MALAVRPIMKAEKDEVGFSLLRSCSAPDASEGATVGLRDG